MNLLHWFILYSL